MTSIRLDVLPAGHGDALVVTYGPADAPSRVLIDGGTARSYATGLRPYIEGLPTDQRHFELFVVTHVDTDHIDGAILLMRDRHDLGVTFGEVWFNDWARIEKLRGAKQGELLGWLLANPDDTGGPSHARKVRPTASAAGQRRSDEDLHVNAAFGGDQPVMQRLDDRVVLPGGAELIVVSPRVAELRKLRTKWETTLAKAKFTPGTADCVKERMDAKYQPPPVADRDASGAPDTEIPNGSSIAVLFTYDRQRLLLAADAHTAVLAESIDGLLDRFGLERLELAAFKLAHHGSAGNLSTELLKRLDCTRFVVSTNGDYFGHPHKQAIEMIAGTADRERPPTVVFNYDGRTTKGYRDDPRINAVYGTDGRATIEI